MLGDATRCGSLSPRTPSPSVEAAVPAHPDRALCAVSCALWKAEKPTTASDPASATLARSASSVRGREQPIRIRPNAPNTQLPDTPNHLALPHRPCGASASRAGFSCDARASLLHAARVRRTSTATSPATSPADHSPPQLPHSLAPPPPLPREDTRLNERICRSALPPDALGAAGVDAPVQNIPTPPNKPGPAGDAPKPPNAGAGVAGAPPPNDDAAAGAPPNVKDGLSTVRIGGLSAIGQSRTEPRDGYMRFHRFHRLIGYAIGESRVRNLRRLRGRRRAAAEACSRRTERWRGATEEGRLGGCGRGATEERCGGGRAHAKRRRGGGGGGRCGNAKRWRGSGVRRWRTATEREGAGSDRGWRGGTKGHPTSRRAAAAAEHEWRRGLVGRLVGGRRCGRAAAAEHEWRRGLLGRLLGGRRCGRAEEWLLELSTRVSHSK